MFTFCWWGGLGNSCPFPRPFACSLTNRTPARCGLVRYEFIEIQKYMEHENPGQNPSVPIKPQELSILIVETGRYRLMDARAQASDLPLSLHVDGSWYTWAHSRGKWGGRLGQGNASEREWLQVKGDHFPSWVAVNGSGTIQSIYRTSSVRVCVSVCVDSMV